MVLILKIAAILLLQLLILNVGVVHSNENDDLVFDADGKSSVSEVPLTKKDDGSFFDRVKRGLSDWWPFNAPENKTTPPPVETSTHHTEATSNGSRHRTLRNSEEEAFDDNNVIEDEEENLDEPNDIDVPDGEVKSVARPKYGNSDDEDLAAGSGEIEGSATDETETNHFPPRVNHQARFYRITLTVLEPYVTAYSDPYSQDYVELSSNLTQALRELLSHRIPDYNHFASVVKISPAEDPFNSEVTLDIGSTYTNENEIRQMLEEQLHYHSLGSIKVVPEGFTFRSFQECPESTNLKCRDGSCVPLSSRCDGVPQCPDNSDELDCPTTIKPIEETTQSIWNISNRQFETDFNETNEVSRGLPTNNCRGDDTVRCSDGSRFICSVQQCDGVKDCDDGADEDSCSGSSCGDGEFSCDVSRCILDRQRCDFNPDCEDGSDERSCNYPACTQNQFRCKNGQCIDNNLRCNLIAECYDKSDELNCPCKDDEFECAALYCIPMEQRCDGVNQCSNGRDEIGCMNITRCRHDEFECGDGSCISKSEKCDGRSNCHDRSDEKNCTDVVTCSSDQFRCLDGTCVSIDKRCNGYYDCGSGEDESQCGCGAGEFRCDDGQCVAYGTRCNDGSDERDSDLAPCPSMDFTCGDGSCIPMSSVCDGFDDCPRADDELLCDRGCTPTQFKCATGGKCIEEIYRCDGRRDCADNSDEDCGVTSIYNDTNTSSHTNISTSDWITSRPLPECDLNVEIRCPEGKCIPIRQKCDGIPHCFDSFDEIDCECPAGQSPCANGICIPKNFFCDLNVDCLDGSDENNCTGSTPYPPSTECRSDEFTCHDRTCIPITAVCDRRQDCGRNEDEENCRGVKSQNTSRNPGRVTTMDNVNITTTTTISCAMGDFVCADGTCIPAAHRCDNFYDCRDFTDEQFCFVCARGQFQCHNGDCTSGKHKCNGFIDCDDGSDEEGCETTTIPSHERHCPSGQFTCASDHSCVYYSSRCNGIPECRDGSDELGCDTDSKNDGLDLKTYPSEQVIKETPVRQGREVVFQCRDEGMQRAKVRWIRGNNLPLPPGSRDINGRLEIPNIQLEHAGEYICEAIGYPTSTPGQHVTVHLEVERFDLPATRPPQVCKYDEATCSNGDCIPKNFVCDGKFDCTDGSDEMRCNPHGCEPNQFRCNNKQCVSKIWRCDGDKDCADGSDEENCGTPAPGSPCRYGEFQCAKYEQCIPKSYHCDMERDCQDGSDEIGCSPVYIIKPPTSMVILSPGETMLLTCTAIGVPIPEINWRLNWGHVPEKCSSTDNNGTGTLTCPDITYSDQGAYSCEAINVAGFVFAVPDAILVVKENETVCPRGQFNSEARRLEDCISCFCFGVATECRSADVYTSQILPPFDRHKVVAVSIENSSDLKIRGDISSQIAEIVPIGQKSVEISIPYSNDLSAYDIPYFALPEAYHGSQLKSYGGYLKYKIRHRGDGRNNSAPSIIITGNGYTLVHRGRSIISNREIEENVRFFVGEWLILQNGTEKLASRQDIMMTLANVDNILIKAKYDDSPQLDISITDIVMDSADIINIGLGSAPFVEECSCPAGYSGSSCEHCSPGYIRRRSGSWLGECYRDEPPCPPGYYGDPSRNIPCTLCPCPLTNPSNQFARTCHLGPDRQPICDCPAGYTGRRCEQCAAGYHGNPLIAGDMCVPDQQCDPDGSLTLTADADGKCRCKLYTTGLLCDQCKPNTFNRAAKNQFGCISCFCMGITNRCVSSNWYRSEILVSFTNSIRDFSLIESLNPNAPAIVSEIRLDSGRREIIYNDFPNRGNGDVYYWQLPSIFLGDQITSYGGNLKYTVRYVPSPGGQSSRNNAADVELISSNDIKLLYYSRESPEPNSAQSFSVPLLEQFWQRVDGTQADREHLLMALANIEAIRIKATYTTHTDEAALSNVSLDIAEKYNTGRERAVEVEECSCPIGYAGLSCENCAAGYTRAIEGLYLGICEPCNCNGHSNQCDPETGICENCGDHTTGDSCDVCESGYEGDATRGTPDDCRSKHTVEPIPQYCNPAGTIYNQSTSYGRCTCKLNAEGPECNRCRPSTFGLSQENPNGCNECYCSGVTDQCHDSSLYIQQIPVWVYDSQHGFTLTDNYKMDVINEGFDINVAMNEIAFKYSPNNRNRRLFWSLPSTFTGNKIKSYGGNLTLTQRYSAHPGSQPFKDQDVLLSGNGITLFWSNPQEINPDTSITYTVPLRETEWRRLTNEGPKSTSRTDLMTVLSNLDSILVRASYSEGMISSHISDISLDTAVENLTGNRRATQIEACRCPLGYSGTSCESCSRGYYRDITDRSFSFLGSCNACPCNDHEESCEITRAGQVRCHCLSGYTGQYCQDVAELRVGLMPMRPEASSNSTIEFKCEYNYVRKMYLTLKLIPFNGLPLTAWITTASPQVLITNGAYRKWNVHVGEQHCIVECFATDEHGMELAKISTTITPVDYPSVTSTQSPLPPPKIIVSVQEKKFQIVHIGSTVRYHCSARSLDNNPVHIRWEKEGGRLPDGGLDDAHGLLIIRGVKVSDSGVYVCQATDGVNVAIEKVTLTVGRSNPVEPKAVIHPSYQQVREGDSVEFRCEATGNPQPEVEWIRVQGQMNPEASFSNGLWKIPVVTKSDAAEYKCIARNSVGVNEQTTILYVSDNPNPPPAVDQSRGPVITPHEWMGTTGDIVRLVCTRSNLQSNVSWTRSSGLPLPSSASQQDGVLTISNPRPSDSGVYVCIATTYQGAESSSSAMITVHNRRNPPRIKVEPERQTVSQGTIAEVKCHPIDRDPELKIKWIKYGENSLGHNAQQIGNILKIINPQVSDRGVYICQATNDAGTFEASAIIEVEPRETPALELYPKTVQIVTIGGSVDLQCRVVAGFPVPEVRWVREDSRPFSSNTEQLPGGLLRITNATIHEGGAYICSAANDVGSTSAIAHIEVQSLPVITITPSGGIIQAKLGSRVRLTCSAEGIPQPNVAWSKHGSSFQLYTPQRPVSATPLTAIHEIMTMSLDDEGSYTCQATNAAGVSEERVQVRLEDDDYNTVDEYPPPCRGDVPCEATKPSHGGIRIPEDYLRIPYGGTVEMRCQVLGPDDTRIYLDWKRSDRYPLPEGSKVYSGVLTIPDVKKDAAGEYICLGLNSDGIELFRAKSHLEIISPPRIELNPNRQVVAPGESPSIVCTATGDQPLRIEWAAIGRSLPPTVRHDQGVLRFHGITFADAGKYVCKATNDAGTAEAVAEVLVNDHSYDDGGIRAVEHDVHTLTGNSVRLRCETRERVGIHWTREGQQLPHNARIDGNSLEFSKIRPEDSGRYICQIRNAQGVSSDYINLSVSSVAGPVVTIEPSSEIVNIGDTIDLRCIFSSRRTDRPRYQWFRPDHNSLPSNVQEYEEVLRLNNVQMADSGIYRCRVDSQEGGFSQDYNLIVQGGENDEPAIEMKNVPYGSSIEMGCRVDLEGQISYKWSKLGGHLPPVIMNDNKMKLIKVKAEDAGTYICTASNGIESSEVPTVLVVTGVIPNFSQAPRSYIALPPLPDSYLKFNIEVSFKPESYDGIILYNAESSNGVGDFVILSLVGGYPEFRLDLGSGPASIRSDKSVSVGEWHTIKLQRNRKDCLMFVDGEGPYKATTAGRKQGLDLKEPLYIGGIPDYVGINERAESSIHTGFVGCISRVVIGEKNLDLIGDQTDSVGVTTCETCAENPCHNSGVCQEAPTKDGYTCLCAAGYSGKLCDSIGESCYPGICGKGHCEQSERGIICHCPHGTSGTYCEHTTDILQPSLRSSRSFLAYQTPKAARKVESTRNPIKKKRSHARSYLAELRKSSSKASSHLKHVKQHHKKH